MVAYSFLHHIHPLPMDGFAARYEPFSASQTQANRYHSFRLIPPHIYISIVVLSWGILASAQSVVTSFPQLLVLRFLLGISEAAFCGVPFYLSFFFRRSELALRTGYFIAAAPLAISCASSLAWLITWLGRVLGGEGWISPWRLLFLVEGFPSCIVAVAVWRFLPDGPDSASFLSRREKQVALLRLEYEQDSQANGATSKEKADPAPDSHSRLKLRDILATLRDPKCYLTAAMFFSCNVAFSSMPVFLPTIIRAMGFSATAAQALSAPPYLISFITVLATSALSDRHRVRSSYIAFNALLASSGYAFICLAGALGLPVGFRYLGVYPACVGFFACVTLTITWTLNNQESDAGKGTGVALLQLFGQCGPLLGTRLFPDTDGPLYIRGMAVCAVFMGLVAVLAWVLRAVLKRENRKRLGGAERRQRQGEDEERLMGSSSKVKERRPFVYML